MPNGADAIYLRLPALNALMRADNSSEDDRKSLMEILHQHGVRGFLTLIRGYQDLLIGRFEAANLIGSPNAADQEGVTEGTLLVLR